MAIKPNLSIVQGTGGNLPTSFGQVGTSQFKKIPIVDADGGTFWKGPPDDEASQEPLEKSGSGGGGAMKLTLPDIRWNVAILNALATLFFIGLIGNWLWMVDRIDDKFEAADVKITDISKTVADLRVEYAEQRADIKTVLEKLDDKHEASPRQR